MNKNVLISLHLILAAILVIIAFNVESHFLRRGSYLAAIGIAYMVVRKTNVEDIASKGWLDDLFSIILVTATSYCLAFIFFAYSTFKIKMMVACVLLAIVSIGIWRIRKRYFQEEQS